MSRRRRGGAPGDVELEIGGRDHRFSIESYWPGTPATYWDPGDGGEVEIGSVVEVDLTYGTEVVTLETAILDYALDYGLSVDKAETRLYDAILEEVQEYCAQREGDD